MLDLCLGMMYTNLSNIAKTNLKPCSRQFLGKQLFYDFLTNNNNNKKLSINIALFKASPVSERFTQIHINKCKLESILWPYMGLVIPFPKIIIILLLILLLLFKVIRPKPCFKIWGHCEGSLKRKHWPYPVLLGTFTLYIIIYLLKELAVLSANGRLFLWDLKTFKQIADTKLKYQLENVCMTISWDHSLYAVGSQSHISFVDPRSAKPIASIESRERGSGEWLSSNCSHLKGILLSFMYFQTEN